jgi:hypothetical protein
MLCAKLMRYQQRSVERTHRACVPAYLLDEDESVIRIWPDGLVERIIVEEGRGTVRALNQHRCDLRHSHLGHEARRQLQALAHRQLDILGDRQGREQGALLEHDAKALLVEGNFQRTDADDNLSTWRRCSHLGPTRECLFTRRNAHTRVFDYEG